MDNKEQRPQSQAEQFIRLFMISKGSTASQVLSFIEDILRCRHRFLSIDDEYVLMIYGYDLNDNDPGMPIGSAHIKKDEELRSKFAFDACFDFLEKMQDVNFQEKMIIYGLTHGRWTQCTAINNFSSIHG